MDLMPHQKKAVEKLSNGKILCGGVGSGKSLVALWYYAHKDTCGDVYIITTAKKRDSLEWLRDAASLGIGTERDATTRGVLIVDSWNNIGKYEHLEGHTFIFDEQRVVGSGAWVKSFYKIAKKNSWVLLSATPGDTWMDYIPVFVANGFFKNKTQFVRDHCVFAPFSRYPRIDRFIGVDKLERLKAEILVDMPYEKHTTRHIEYVDVPYDKEMFDRVWKDRWNVYTDEPIRDAAELFAVAKRVVYESEDRMDAVRKILKEHPRLIVYYSFNYELNQLRKLADEGWLVAEWNGQKHENVPEGDKWVYLVQYMAGAEGWNCTSTDAMCFYSLTYSYRMFEQAQGRIDRLDTLYNLLSYFVLTSTSVVDKAVLRAQTNKKNFNEKKFLRDDFKFVTDLS